MTFESQKADSLNMYSNIFGYLRAPLVNRFESDEIDVVISGIAFDMAVTGRPGARFGPSGIRKASANLTWEKQRWPWKFDWRDYIKLADVGDIAYIPAKIDDMLEKLRAHATNVLNFGKIMLTLGGDHLVTLPLLRAYANKYGKIALIHFDSHTDTDDDGGFNHGTMFHHAWHEGLVDPAHSIQVGIRTWYNDQSHPYKVLDAGWCNEQKAEEIAAQIIKMVGDAPAYISLDIDVLDPAYAPGTGTPVPGGFTTDLLLKIIRNLVPLQLVGMDIVEVAPQYDSGEITSLAAAAMGLEFLCVLAEQKRRQAKS